LEPKFIFEEEGIDEKIKKKGGGRKIKNQRHEKKTKTHIAAMA